MAASACMGAQFIKKITRILLLFVPEGYWSPTPVNQNVAIPEVANELYVEVSPASGATTSPVLDKVVDVWLGRVLDPTVF